MANNINDLFKHYFYDLEFKKNFSESSLNRHLGRKPELTEVADYLVKHNSKSNSNLNQDINIFMADPSNNFYIGTLDTDSLNVSNSLENLLEARYNNPSEKDFRDNFHKFIISEYRTSNDNAAMENRIRCDEKYRKSGLYLFAFENPDILTKTFAPIGSPSPGPTPPVPPAPAQSDTLTTILKTAAVPAGIGLLYVAGAPVVAVCLTGGVIIEGVRRYFRP